MTAPIQVLLAGGGSGLINPAVTLLDSKAGATATASITLNADGTVTVAGSGSTCVPANWNQPTTAGIGAQYWAQAFTNNSTTGGAVLSLSAGQLFGQVQSVVGTKTDTWTIKIWSNAAGTALAGSIGPFTATATRTS